MNRTPNLELVLYEANDIMDGVEFINDNNSKIDTYASQTRAIAQSANALAGQANEGVGAADTKIEAINTRLQQDEVDTLPQYKTDTDARLDVLEDDVNSFTNPKAINFTVSNVASKGLYKSGGMLFYNYTKVINYTQSPNKNTAVGEVYKDYGSLYNGFTETETTGLWELATIAENIFNMPNINEKYCLGVCNMTAKITQSGGNIVPTTAGVSVIGEWTGVNTVLYARTDVPENGNYKYLFNFTIPLGGLN